MNVKYSAEIVRALGRKLDPGARAWPEGRIRRLQTRMQLLEACTDLNDALALRSLHLLPGSTPSSYALELDDGFRLIGHLSAGSDGPPIFHLRLHEDL
jgi:plasmid maintenance system killer protein